LIILSEKQLAICVSKALALALNEDHTNEIKKGILNAFNTIFSDNDGGGFWQDKSSMDKLKDICHKGTLKDVCESINKIINEEKFIDSIVDRILKKQLKG